MRLLALTLSAAALVGLAGCDAVTTPAGPAALRVDVMNRFDDDRVVVLLDGERVFDDRVTTQDVLSLAEQVPLSIPAGAHELRALVNGTPSAVLPFDTDDVVVIQVHYDPAGNAVTLAPFAEPPLYD